MNTEEKKNPHTLEVGRSSRPATYKSEQELLQAKAALRATAERLQLALSASKLGDWSFSTETGLLSLSDRAARIAGFDGAMVIAQSQMNEMVHEADRAWVLQAVDDAIANNKNIEIEHRFVQPSGRTIWVASRACCTHDAEGRLLGLTGVVQDVTEQKQADEALRTSEARFRQLADSMPQIVWTAGPDGRMDYFNRRWYESTTEAEGLAEAKGWRSIVHPDDVPRCRSLWFESVASGKPFENEYRFRDKSGRYRWHLGRALPVFDEAGGILRWFGTSTDIDDQKRAEERIREETRVLELLNRTGSIISSTLDLQSLMQKVTDAAKVITGAEIGAFFYRGLDAQGQATVLFTVAGAPREAFSYLGQPRDTDLLGPTFAGEEPIRSDDVLSDPRYGKNRPYFGTPPGHPPVRSYLGVPVKLRSGQVLGGLFFGHSQTSMFSERSERLAVGVAGQAAVALDNARLYEDVRRAAEEREALLDAERAAREEAERASRMKDEFLATLSHELRTPLTAIMGWAQILKAGTSDPEKLSKGIETIERNSRAQAQLIEDLLDMNRIVSGKLQLHNRPVNVAEVVGLAIDAVRLSAEAKNIRLRALLDPTAGQVLGDPDRLQQIFWNLLTNAVKFTPRGGNVEVLVERVNGSIEVTVDDSGRGISPEFLPFIFDRFRQADSSSTRAHGGLGLGLSIVKHLVELHGGTVEATSKGDNTGATFKLSLPLAASQADLSQPHSRLAAGGIDAPAIQDLTGIKVLVVDNEPDVRELVESILCQAGAQVRTAASADAALMALQSMCPDVLVTDIGMESKDGYQLLQEVRKLPTGRGGALPAVALTGFARPEDRRKAIAAGFQRHVSKPIEPDELVAIVGELARAWDLPGSKG